MLRNTEQLKKDAMAVWLAGVDSVRGGLLVRRFVKTDGQKLWIGDDTIELDGIRRIAVVGAGKAVAHMAVGLEETLGPEVAREKELTGIVNVPMDCLEKATRLSRIHLHGARPAGCNEPRAEGVTGVEQMLSLVGSLESDDLCFCLISGGGSALAPAPPPGVSLSEKGAVVQLLSDAGAPIEEMNIVRHSLSRFKGGRLARACCAGRLETLVISDVAGDSLAVVASGPTVETPFQGGEALDILRRYEISVADVAPSVLSFLEKNKACEPIANPYATPEDKIFNRVIGNNAKAVDSAGMEAERRGYSHAMTSSQRPEGDAATLGRHLGDMALRMRHQSGPDCLISGGEPTVKLAPVPIRGKGGRNQHLALAALARLFEQAQSADLPPEQATEGIVLLAGGTDGEDGPTDAAGAMITPETAMRVCQLGLDPKEYLYRNDAYNFFNAIDGLVKTGPTGTNVRDIRIITVDRKAL